VTVEPLPQYTVGWVVISVREILAVEVGVQAVAASEPPATIVEAVVMRAVLIIIIIIITVVGGDISVIVLADQRVGEVAPVWLIVIHCQFIVLALAGYLEGPIHREPVRITAVFIVQSYEEFIATGGGYLVQFLQTYPVVVAIVSKSFLVVLPVHVEEWHRVAHPALDDYPAVPLLEAHVTEHLKFAAAGGADGVHSTARAIGFPRAAISLWNYMHNIVHV